MGKLIRMDLYRMLKSKTFLICLLLAFLLALGNAPFEKLMFTLANSLSADINETFAAEVSLSGILSDPFPLFNLMLALLSLCWFFYADVENGYIKNIAGQMPMKGFTVLSKFIAASVHNIIFAAAGIIGNLVGTLLVRQLIMDVNVLEVIRVLALKLLLVHSICASLLLVVTTFRSKAFGMILAVVFGMGLSGLIYAGINEAVKPLFGEETNIARYMPDTVMAEKPLNTVKSLLVAFGWGAVFLLPAIRIFDRKDVK